MNNTFSTVKEFLREINYSMIQFRKSGGDFLVMNNRFSHNKKIPWGNQLFDDPVPKVEGGDFLVMNNRFSHSKKNP